MKTKNSLLTLLVTLTLALGFVPVSAFAAEESAAKEAAASEIVAAMEENMAVAETKVEEKLPTAEAPADALAKTAAETVVKEAKTVEEAAQTQSVAPDVTESVVPEAQVDETVSEKQVEKLQLKNTAHLSTSALPAIVSPAEGEKMEEEQFEKTALLKGITVDGGILNPVFEPATRKYVVNVFPFTTQLTLKAESADGTIIEFNEKEWSTFQSNYTPGEGYSFNGTVDLRYGEEVLHLTAASADGSVASATYSVTVRAMFIEPEVFGISVTSDGNGEAYASLTEASAGTNVSLNAMPFEGYRFLAWQVVEGDVQIQNGNFVMPAGKVHIHAVFEAADTPEVQPLVLHIQLSTGETLTLEAMPTDTIGDIRLRVADMTGLVLEQQQLLIDGVLLEDGQTLASCEIHGDSTISLVVKAKKTIIWLDGDGSVLDEAVVYGDDMEPMTALIPTKADDLTSSYVFASWEVETEDAETKTYRPVFTSKPLVDTDGKKGGEKPVVKGDSENPKSGKKTIGQAIVSFFKKVANALGFGNAGSDANATQTVDATGNEVTAEEEDATTLSADSERPAGFAPGIVIDNAKTDKPSTNMIAAGNPEAAAEVGAAIALQTKEERAWFLLMMLLLAFSSSFLFLAVTKLSEKKIRK